MIWIFVILGAAALIAALIGLVSAGSGRRVEASWHALAIVLLGIAWFAEHTTLGGRMCLLAAAAIETLIWLTLRFKVREVVRRRSIVELEGPAIPPPASSQQPDPGERSNQNRREQHAGSALHESPTTPAPEVDPAPDSDALTDLQAPAPSETMASPNTESEAIDPPPAEIQPAEPSQVEPAIGEPKNTIDTLPSQPLAYPETFATYLLLESSYSTAASVFLASLRRSGQRDAVLIDGMDEDKCIQVAVGGVTINIRSLGAPVDISSLADPPEADQWHESASIIARHRAHIAVTTTCDQVTTAHERARMHHRAHAALAEFAPSLGVLWPEAGLFTPAVDLLELSSLGREDGIAGSCTSRRRFELDGANAGLTLIDTLGLFGLGLPDVQLITDTPAAASVDPSLTALIERMLLDGCHLQDGDEYEMGDNRRWRVTHTRSAFAPDRPVLQIAIRRGEHAAGASESDQAAG